MDPVPLLQPEKEFLVKKIRFLQNKARNVLEKAEKRPIQDIVSNSPTLTLFVCGCGAGSSVTFPQLMSIFQDYEGFEKVYSFKAKPYAMVTYRTEEAASSVYQALHAKFCPQIQKILILEYSLYTPQHEKPTEVPGLVLMEDFISEEEEMSIVEGLNQSQSPWIRLSQRYVQHYGYTYRYETNDVDPYSKSGDLPFFTESTVQRIMDTGMVEHVPDQLTVNKYSPGSGIPGHVDTHSMFEEALISLSMMAHVIMEFRHPNGIVVPVLLPRRSLLILKGEARYLWSHGISPRKTDFINGIQIPRDERISLTFRTVRRSGECNCKYNVTWQCDTWLSRHTATRTEQKYVYETYEAIAPHFSDTRYKPWPKMEKFLMSQPPGTLVCDVGCGNGRYLGICPSIFMCGVDTCFNLLKIARDRSFEVSQCNNLSLPFRSNSYDVALSIAVIHHFSTEQHRLQALQELHRILKPGGTLKVYVWAFEQDKHKFRQQDVFVPWKMGGKYAKEEETESVELERKNDVQKENGVYQRYYHMFKEGELEKLVTMCGGFKIVVSEYDHHNWAVEAKKIGEQ